MHPLTLHGGATVPAGVYRQVHSGRLIYLATPGTLPGQGNSEIYVQVPQAALFNQQHRYVPSEHRSDHSVRQL
jgi:hypothetical protein